MSPLHRRYKLCACLPQFLRGQPSSCRPLTPNARAQPRRGKMRRGWGRRPRAASSARLAARPVPLPLADCRLRRLVACRSTLTALCLDDVLIDKQDRPQRFVDIDGNILRDAALRSPHVPFCLRVTAGQTSRYGYPRPPTTPRRQKRARTVSLHLHCHCPSPCSQKGTDSYG